MLFGRSDKKRSHPIVAVTIGGLAMLGAFSVVRCAKRMMKTSTDKVTGAMKRMMGSCDCGCQSECE